MRRPLVLLLVLLLVLGGASFALWSWTVARMEVGFAAWAARQAAEGWTVHAAATHGTGWPLAAELVLSDLSLAAAPGLLPGGAGWTAERAVLHISPLLPGVMEVRLDGTQRLHGFGGPGVPFVADRFTLTLPLRGAAAAQIAGRQLRFGAPADGMTIGLLDGTIQPESPPRVELSAEAIALPPPPVPQPALGARIASATITATLEGALPPPSPDLAARLAAWQRAGGMLRVQHVAVGWGPLGITGTAAIGLDADLQPQGTGTARVVGYDATLSALAAGGAVRPQAAQAIRAVLTLLARTPEGGGAPEVELPLSVQDGVLRVGRIPVGRLPHWDWSAAR